jgi:hypothetical protein
MAIFLEGLLADARWYALSIFLTAALIVDFYLLSHSPFGALGLLVTIVLSLVMTSCTLLLLRSLVRWLKSKTPTVALDTPGELGSLHFRVADGKKSK